eukprot:CAMPEP_0196571788 /NCGR_PEP_ID=MMETSP1081-20130531/1920_1 /TAXON_ID=36882 /ORGANISM="Pyramimonas amylifera, Strain CCMP720" /LENGTH=244 /DNA_ID=CAMNT_0041888861 /DNA_START=54 /DNA_END=788 /DNA_ORIENTATION=-
MPLIKEEYSKWKFDDLGLPYPLEVRGFDGKEFFPDYPYREDGLLVWAAMVDFVKDYVTLYYASDEEIVSDSEIQQWYYEALQVGHSGLVEAGTLQIPELVTRDALSKVLVYLLWNFSAQNTAMTRPSYEAYGFPPNRPTMLQRAPPRVKGACTEVTFLEMMPDKGTSATVAGFMHWRSERTAFAAPLLGPQMEDHFLDPDALDCFDRFQTSLKLVQKVIEGRNDRRGAPYMWMLPSMITTGLVH